MSIKSSHRLHICLLTSARVFDLSYGGDGKFSTSLGRFIALQDHNVTLLASGFANIKSKLLTKNDSEIRNDDILQRKKIRVLNPPYAVYAFSRLIMSILWVMAIWKVDRKNPISLIHAQDTGYSGLAAIISGKILGIPVILSSHGIRNKVIESYIKGRLKNVLLKIEYRLDIFTTKHADKVIVDNPSIKEYFEQKVSSDIEFIPIPIKIKKFEYSEAKREMIRTELGIDKEIKVIGFVGRLEPVKNLFTLLSAFADAAKDDPLIKLVLVGTGHLERELKDYVAQKNMGNRVIFAGLRYDIDVVLAGFDIFVLPSFTEGLPTALLEAMACGRSILCSDIPANCEVVSHNENALTFNPANTQELVRCIRLLSEDELLRSKLGINAKKKVTQYDEDIVFPKLLLCYEALSRVH